MKSVIERETIIIIHLQHRAIGGGALPFVCKVVLNLSLVFLSHVLVSNCGALVTRQDNPYYIIGILTDGEAHSFPVLCTDTFTMEHRVPRALVEGRNIYISSRNGVFFESLWQLHLKEKRITSTSSDTKRSTTYHKTLL